MPEVIKWFGTGHGGRRLAAVRLKDHTDEKGVVWRAWTPSGLSLSVWVRLESDHHRTCFVYDPGGSFRKSLN